MAMYKAKQRLFIGSRLIEAGEKFEVDDSMRPGSQWEAVDRAATLALEAKNTARGLAAVADLAPAIPVTPPGSGKPHFTKDDIQIPTATPDDIEAAKKWREHEAARVEREAKEAAEKRAEEDKAYAKRQADEKAAREKAEKAAAAERKGTR